MPKLRKKTEADLSAVFSDDVAYRTYRNQTVVSTITRPTPSTSEATEKSKEFMAKASSWAKDTLMDPALKKHYSKGINEKMTSAHNVAVQDYYHPPTIHYIGLKQHTGAIGDTIRIKATDNFEVTSVDVVITDKNGKEIEKGAAVKYKRKPVMWIYTLTVTNPELEGTVIKVTAKDRPKNETVKEETISASSLKDIKAIKSVSKSGNETVQLKSDIRKIVAGIEDKELLRKVYGLLKQGEQMK